MQLIDWPQHPDSSFDCKSAHVYVTLPTVVVAHESYVETEGQQCIVRSLDSKPLRVINV